MKRLLATLVFLLSSCTTWEEQLKIQMALEDYRDSQAEFGRMYPEEIRLFELLQRPNND